MVGNLERERENMKMKEVKTEQQLRELIRTNPNAVDWDHVSYRQPLSEEFIREFQDKVGWNHVSYRQTLSEEFISEFQDKLNLEIIFTVQDYSEDFELMKEYTQNNPESLQKTKTAINKKLLDKLEACGDGVVRFLEHTKPEETIDWFELKKRHKRKSDLAWLFERLV